MAREPAAAGRSVGSGAYSADPRYQWQIVPAMSARLAPCAHGRYSARELPLVHEVRGPREPASATAGPKALSTHLELILRFNAEGESSEYWRDSALQHETLQTRVISPGAIRLGHEGPGSQSRGVRCRPVMETRTGSD